MLRNPTRVLVQLLCSLIILSASACGNATSSSAVPTPTREAQKITLIDIKPILRDFLANLPADWNLVASQDVAKLSPFILDVRQPEEYKQGFIAGAVNIPLRDLTSSLQALPSAEKDILVVCDTGHRSAIGMAVIQMLGYKKAKTLDGGMRAWQTLKQPVVTAPIPAQAKSTPQVDPHVQATLDYYLRHTLPHDWGIINTTGLASDQKLMPSSAGEAMPETYDQGPSLLVDVDTREEFAKSNLANFQRAINVPLRQLPDSLDTMPLQSTVDWA